MLADVLPEIVIRQARPDENNSVHALLQIIADEALAYLFAPAQVPIGEANWFSAWLAISNEEIVGVTMTRTRRWTLDHIRAMQVIQTRRASSASSFRARR
jgi:hypothetical protein